MVVFLIIYYISEIVIIKFLWAVWAPAHLTPVLCSSLSLYCFRSYQQAVFPLTPFPANEKSS